MSQQIKPQTKPQQKKPEPKLEFKPNFWFWVWIIIIFILAATAGPQKIEMPKLFGDKQEIRKY